MGAGTPSSPTTAVLNFNDTLFGFGIITVKLVDNGGNGMDTLGGVFGRDPTDCSPLSLTGGPLTNGRAVVFDAPFPTSKDQCKGGGWQDFPPLKNQGDCISSVNNGE
jgi:hypothetical protein